MEQQKRIRQNNQQRRHYYESQKRKIVEYNRKKKETEVLLGMHLNETPGLKFGRLYSPNSSNLINKSAEKIIDNPNSQTKIYKPNRDTLENTK